MSEPLLIWKVKCSWSACQVLIKPKPVFQAAVVSEQTRQLVTETLQQVTRAADQGQAASADGSGKEESGSSGGDGSHGSAQGNYFFVHRSLHSGLTASPELNISLWSHCSSDPQPVVHVVSSREQDWPEQDVAIASSPTIIYQEVSAGESQSATSTIKALLELQQTGELSRSMKWSELQNPFDTTRGSSRPLTAQ